ncbi:hypothetical protein ACF5W4_14915 [Bacillota bacterium Lsc_1132]
MVSGFLILVGLCAAEILFANVALKDMKKNEFNFYEFFSINDNDNEKE